MLNALHSYCKAWKLTVNISKTKIMIFSRGKVVKIPSWHFGPEPLEVEYNYTYLGTIFNFNGNFNKAKEKQICQAKRAMHGLLSKARKLNLPPDIISHLFDVCIVPILLYGCEIWGFSDLTEIERVQLFFCKYILRLNRSTANCMVLGELGRLPIECLIKQRMLNFWARLISGKTSKLAHIVLMSQKYQHDVGTYKPKWLVCIKDMLDQIGLSYVWNADPENIDTASLKSLFKEKVNDIELQNWHSKINTYSHCVNYRIFKSKLHLEDYLTLLDPKNAISLCRFRCGNHKLPIVTGRYNKIDRQERKCKLCSSGDLGDEYHYIMCCSHFKKERAALIRNRYSERPNTQKFNRLFNSTDPQELTHLAKFTHIIMKKFKYENFRKNCPKRRTKKTNTKVPTKTKVKKTV